MEAESRKQQLRAEAEAQRRAAAAAQKEEGARIAQERMQQLQTQWRESEALKQVPPHGSSPLLGALLVFTALTAAFMKTPRQPNAGFQEVSCKGSRLLSLARWQ